MDDSQKIDELILLVAELTKALEKERALRLAEALESLEKRKCSKVKCLTCEQQQQANQYRDFEGKD